MYYYLDHNKLLKHNGCDCCFIECFKNFEDYIEQDTLFTLFHTTTHVCQGNIVLVKERAGPNGASHKPFYPFISSISLIHSGQCSNDLWWL